MNAFVETFICWLLNLGALVMAAWGLMIFVGAVHGEWLPTVPTIGFDSAVMLATVVWVFAIAVTSLRAISAAISDTKS